MSSRTWPSWLGYASSALCVLWLLALVGAQTESARDERQTTVGMRGRIDSLVLPGTALIARPKKLHAPLSLRVVASWPHGTDTRYDLEYYGLEPGTYDLSLWLMAPDGSSPAGLPAIEVEVRPVLPPGQVEPREIEIQKLSEVGGYRTWLTIGGLLWLAGLALMIATARKKRVEQQSSNEVAPPKTLAERLRPSVQLAKEGQLDQRGKAELERLLLAHWRERLDLSNVKSAHAIAKLRQHDQAGALLRQLELWLHAKPEPGSGEVDVDALLAPYEKVQAHPHEEVGADRPIAAKGGTA